MCCSRDVTRDRLGTLLLRRSKGRGAKGSPWCIRSFLFPGESPEETHDLAAHNLVDCQNCQCFICVVVVLVFSSCILCFHIVVVVAPAVLPEMNCFLDFLSHTVQIIQNNLRTENEMYGRQCQIKIYGVLSLRICFTTSEKTIVRKSL